MSSTPPSTCSQIAHTALPSSPAHSPTLPATTASPSRTWTSPLFASTATGKASNDPQRRPPPPRHQGGQAMTTDPFTDAAEDRVDELWPYAPAGFPLPPARRMDRRIGFRLGAQWARTHLTAQEPTDAEVLAALNADYAIRFGPRNLPADSLEPYGDERVQIMRAALSTARRDEKDTP